MTKNESKKCNEHRNHVHAHGPNCGHESVQHDDHVDYLHDGHFHRVHEDHIDECTGPKQKK
jgi:hypothetical protein